MLHYQRYFAKGGVLRTNAVKIFSSNSFSDRIVVSAKGNIVLNPMLCSGCGTPFQTKFPMSPGFLAKDKFDEHQVKMELRRKKDDVMRVLDTAGISAHSEEARSIFANVGLEAPAEPAPLPLEPATNDEVIDLNEIKQISDEKRNHDAVCVCQRCFRLKQYQEIQNELRPGQSTDELLMPQKFEQVLSIIKEQKAVVLCLVDIFDIAGSIPPNLRKIAGNNPIIIGVNKIDLIPMQNVPIERMKRWLYKYILERAQLVSPQDKFAAIHTEKRESIGKKGFYDRNLEANMEHEGLLRLENIHFISASKGDGFDSLLQQTTSIAEKYNRTIYVLGSANVGKSSFINRLIDNKVVANLQTKGARLQSKALSRSGPPQATVSLVPGTTLNAIKIYIPRFNTTFIDTPGVLNQGQLTMRLPTVELKAVIPSRRISRVTHRVSMGKCVLIGGYAKISLQEGKPMFLTFFVSDEVVLRPADVNKANSLLENHIGTLIKPPFTKDALAQLGPFREHVFEVCGTSWKSSVCDIAIAGLGWLSITGPGVAKIAVSVPEFVDVTIREPILPFEAWDTLASYTGGKWIQKNNR